MAPPLTPVPRPLSPRDGVALVVLAALWGGSFLFFRVAAPAVGPVMVAFWRVVLAGAALVAYAAFVGREVDWGQRGRAFLVLGALNAALPYSLIAAAELHLTASAAAILNATTPLFAVAVAALRLGEPITDATVAGLILGMTGVAILVGWSPLPLDWRLALAVGASLIAALSYALAGVFAKTAFAGAPPLTLAIGQQIGAAVLLLPLAAPIATAGRTDLRPSLGVAGAIVGLALLCTSAAYLLYFHLIRSVGPTRTLTVTLLAPIFGVLWSALFLDEAIGAGTLIGLGVVLIGVVLVTGAGIGRR